MFQSMKDALSAVGKLADERPAEPLVGHLAEHPSTPSLKGSIRVWSPCGCCLTYMNKSASVLTQCDAKEHDFDWVQAEQAIAALQAAEAPATESKGEASGQPSKLAIVAVPKT